MTRSRTVETVVVGAGQAGTLMSDLLTREGREHVVLERRSTLGGGWQDRWDGFRLVGPNWLTSMPGFPYAGDEPDGFMRRDEVIAHYRAYAAAVEAPVELETDVTRLSVDDGRGFRLETSRGALRAREVVVAGGPFGLPMVPAIGGGLAPAIHQVHAHDYRRPDDLPPGGVLLVGTGQTGVQLAEELHRAGRPVVLAVGRCGRVPRRYRGRDIFWWLRELGTRGRAFGLGLPTAATLPNPAARFACNPHLSGHDGGHEIDLRRLGRDGIRLVGRLTAIDGTRVRFAADLSENLALADRYFPERLQRLCDAYAAQTGLLEPAEDPEPIEFQPPETAELDLAAEGISTVLWTSGYRPAFGWIEAPVLDDLGLPIQQGGRTSVPGLSFIGTPWLVDMVSSNLIGLVRDAEALMGAGPDS